MAFFWDWETMEYVRRRYYDAGVIVDRIENDHARQTMTVYWREHAHDKHHKDTLRVANIPRNPTAWTPLPQRLSDAAS
jgi:hypothetical protein